MSINKESESVILILDKKYYKEWKVKKKKLQENINKKKEALKKIKDILNILKKLKKNGDEEGYLFSAISTLEAYLESEKNIKKDLEKKNSGLISDYPIKEE